MDIPKNNSHQDLIYKKTAVRDLALTFIPPLNHIYELAPIYFLITGGGWYEEKKEDFLEVSKISVEKLRSNGFAVVSIDYRTSKEGAVMQEIITDCFDAVRYISHFKDVLKIDKKNIFIAGHSAGAHLALMVAYAHENMFTDNYEYSDEFTIKAAAALSAPTMLHVWNSHHIGSLDALFGDSDSNDERKRLSPISHVSAKCPPTLLCAGTSDWSVFASCSEKLFDELKANNVPCDLKLSICGGHMFEKVHNDLEPSISADEIQKIVAQFGIKYLKGVE